ncbi:MAG: hypothetical protein ACOYM9_08535 [Bradymonadia bacterium]
MSLLRPEHCTLYSGGAAGSEAEFGDAAEAWGLSEVNFSFAGHAPVRTRGLIALDEAALDAGTESLLAIGRALRRQFPETPHFRRLLLSLWHQVHHGEAVFVIGRIEADGTVTGGTGWGAEYARQCNKPLWVFDQARDAWFRWNGEEWEVCEPPVVGHGRFTGTGTRFLEPNGRAAIAALFERSFGALPGRPQASARA